MNKTCSDCKKVLPLSNFYSRKKSKDGLAYRCKWCSHKSAYKAVLNKASKYGLSVASIQRYGFTTALTIYRNFSKKCTICGSEYDLTIHHKDGQGRNYLEKRLSMNNDISNLVILCRRCHGSIDGKKNKGHHPSRVGKLNPFYGKTHTTETRAKMKLAKLGNKNAFKLKNI